MIVPEAELIAFSGSLGFNLGVAICFLLLVTERALQKRKTERFICKLNDDDVKKYYDLEYKKIEFDYKLDKDVSDYYKILEYKRNRKP